MNRRYVISLTLFLLTTTLLLAQGSVIVGSSNGLLGALGSNSGEQPPKNKLVEKTPVTERTKNVGLVRVQITDCFIGPLREVDAFSDVDIPLKAATRKDYLQFKVKLHNISPKAPAPYWSWAFHAVSPAHLKDSADADIPVWQPTKLPSGAFGYPKGGVRVGGMLKPEASATDIIAFDVPAKLDADLTLVLSAQNLGAKASKDLTYTIPAKWFDKGDKSAKDAPPIGPAKKTGKSTIYAFKVGDTGRVDDRTYVVEQVIADDFFILKIATFRFIVVGAKSSELSDGAAVSLKGNFTVQQPTKLRDGRTLQTIRASDGKILPK